MCSSPSPGPGAMLSRPASSTPSSSTRRRDDVGTSVSRHYTYSTPGRRSSPSPKSSSLPAITSLAARSLLAGFTLLRESPAENLQRTLTALADEASRVKALADSREQTILALRLELEDVSRVSGDAQASGRAELSRVSGRVEEAEVNVRTMDARGISWEVMCRRAAEERCKAERLAAAAKGELAAAVKETNDAQAEGERAANRASEAARLLDAARAAEENAADARARDAADFGVIRASLTLDPEHTAAIMLDCRRKAAAASGEGGGGRHGAGVDYTATSKLAPNNIRIFRGVNILSDAQVEDPDAAAWIRLVAETGFSSATELAQRMCGGQDDVEAAHRADIADTERRIRQLKREARECARERDVVTLHETPTDIDLMAATRERSAAEAKGTAAGAVAVAAQARLARTSERVTQARIGVEMLLTSMLHAAAVVRGGYTMGKQPAMAAFGNALGVKEVKYTLVNHVDVSTKPINVSPLSGDQEFEEGGWYKAGDDGDVDETLAVTRALSALQTALDQISSAAATVAVATSRWSEDASSSTHDQSAVAMAAFSPSALQVALTADVTYSHVGATSASESEGDSYENVVHAHGYSCDVLTTAATTSQSSRKLPRMLVAARAGKENGQAEFAASKLVRGGLNRAAATNNRRITLSDFYGGRGNASGANGAEASAVMKRRESGVRVEARKGIDADGPSSVDDAHRAARLAARHRELVCAKAAKKQARRDDADAASIAEDAAKAAVYARFSVDKLDGGGKDGAKGRLPCALGRQRSATQLISGGNASASASPAAAAARQNRNFGEDTKSSDFLDIPGGVVAPLLTRRKHWWWGKNAEAGEAMLGELTLTNIYFVSTRVNFGPEKPILVSSL